MLREKLISLLFLCFLANNPFARAQSFDSVASKFRKYHEHVVHEKVFLHLDKANYLTGETLRFKAYCVEAASNVPLDLSKVLYVEIVSRGGKPVIQTKVILENGMGSGSVFLPATLLSDNYSIVAYTNWMKNFPKEFFFQQAIALINPFKPIEATPKTPPGNNVDIQLFPEGGRLLSGVESKIAFRVVGSDGRGLNFNGEVIDDSGIGITNFKPTKFGLGTFMFTAVAGKKYKVIITDERGVRHEVDFPEVHDKGYSLSVTREGSNYSAVVSAKDFDEPVVHLFIHAKNKTSFSATAYVRNGEALFTIPLDKMQDGISHVTAFDSRLNPVAERLLYRKPANASALTISTDAASYSGRRKVQMKLGLKNLASATAKANISLSVFRIDSLSYWQQQNIETFLSLTSELHGQLESPEHYLTAGTEEEFDNLMLTHGWRRFSWEKVLTSEFKYQWLPEIEGPMLQGVLLDETGKPASNITTYLSTPSPKVQLYTSTTNANGRFSFSLKDIHGQGKIYLQTKFTKDSLYDFRIESPFLPNSSSITTSPLELRENVKQTLLSRSVAMQVQDVFNESPEGVVGSDSTAFYGRPDETYFLDDFTRFSVMEEVMREYVKGVWVRKRQNEFYFMVLDNVNKAVFDQNPLVLLDGVPVFRVNDIMAINPLKIKKIDVLTKQFFHGKTAYAGMVSFTTYSNDLAGIKMDRRNLVIDYEGLQQKRVFFTPIYETERQRSNHMPDQRNVLLWIPSAAISAGTTQIDCFTSDLPGNYEINVQGVSDNGSPVSGRHTFTVSDFNN
ncbi:MAG TPA: Ig-like domain-containing protein [Chryseosolibacter sp.]